MRRSLGVGHRCLLAGFLLLTGHQIEAKLPTVTNMSCRTADLATLFLLHSGAIVHLEVHHVGCANNGIMPKTPQMFGPEDRLRADSGPHTLAEDWQHRANELGRWQSVLEREVARLSKPW